MLARPLAMTIALLFVALPLSGCIGADKAGGTDDLAPANDTPNQPSAALPDGRGESSAIKETNKTEEGRFGMEHLHDYWQGSETVTILDREVYFTSTPVFPDGEGSDPRSVSYVKLGALPDDPDRYGLVYEGADSITITASTPMYHPECEVLNCQNVAGPGTTHPAPPKLSMSYRSAADSDWREPLPLAYDQPITIDVNPMETDMPHSESSLWVFRLTTDKPESMSIRYTVTVHKGREVVDWPGHPDFYAEKDSRIVMQESVSTHMTGIQEGILYDGSGTWVHPSRLISWGTTDLIVFVNITRATNAYNADATGFFLEVHNATIIGPEITFGTRYSDDDKPEDLVSWNFHVPVDAAGMDGPYQPESRWGFRAMATFANVGVPGVAGVGLCPGCFPYDIEYDITVIAVSAPDGLEISVA